MDFISLLDDNDIDIGFITESWMTSQNNHTSALLQESGFNFYHYFRPNQKGGGVGIVARSQFIPKSGKAMHFNTFEICMQSFKIPNSHPLSLVVIYRHDTFRYFFPCTVYP